MNCFLLSLLLFLELSGKDVLSAIVKLLPMIGFATITVVLKLIIESKKNKVTFLNVVMTLIFALGISYIFWPIIQEYIKPSMQGVATGAIVLTGEKIVTYVIYKAKIDEFLAWLFDAIFTWIKSLFKG